MIFRVLWDVKATKVIEDCLQQHAIRLEYEILNEDLALMVRFFDYYIRDNLALLKLIIQVCKYSSISRIETSIEQQGARIIERSLLFVIKQ